VLKKKGGIADIGIKLPELPQYSMKYHSSLVAGVTAGEESWLVGAFRLPRDDGVRFPGRAAFIIGSFQAFVCDLHP
jgi:hypothetical protein